jgi:hypothetical protein
MSIGHLRISAHDKTQWPTVSGGMLAMADKKADELGVPNTMASVPADYIG